MSDSVTNDQAKIFRALYTSNPCCGCCSGDDNFRQETIRDVIVAMGHPFELIKVTIAPWRQTLTFAVPDLDLEPDEIADLFGRHLVEAEYDTLTLGPEIEP